MSRMYWSSENSPPILNGTWVVPAAKKVARRTSQYLETFGLFKRFWEACTNYEP
jgi:hypothetical protein